MLPVDFTVQTLTFPLPFPGLPASPLLIVYVRKMSILYRLNWKVVAKPCQLHLQNPDRNPHTCSTRAGTQVALHLAVSPGLCLKPKAGKVRKAEGFLQTHASSSYSVARRLS